MKITAMYSTACNVSLSYHKLSLRTFLSRTLVDTSLVITNAHALDANPRRRWLNPDRVIKPRVHFHCMQDRERCPGWHARAQSTISIRHCYIRHQPSTIVQRQCSVPGPFEADCIPSVGQSKVIADGGKKRNLALSTINNVHLQVSEPCTVRDLVPSVFSSAAVSENIL